MYGDGRVNANTAPIQVLRAMFKEDQGQRDVATEIMHGRGGFLNTQSDQEDRKAAQEERQKNEEEGVSESEEDVSAFRSVNDLNKVEGLDDSEFLRRNDVQVGRDFTVRSNFFTVTVTAQRENFLRQQRVVLERHPAGCLTWATEVRAADLGDLPEGASIEQPPTP